MAVYWNDKHQLWCEMWLSADTKQEYILYDKLHGGLAEMFGNICRRYFSVPFSKQNELQEDCINHVLVQLKSHYLPQKQKAYTFIGTCMRNWLTDRVVRRYSTHYDSTVELQDELDNNSKPITYGDTFEIDIAVVRKYFNGIREKLKKTYAYNPKSEKYAKLCVVLSTCMEFVETYDSLNIYAMAEYCLHKINLNEDRIKVYFNILFGFHVRPNRKDRFNDTNKDNLDYINDDWTPEENVYASRKKIKKIIDNHEDY